MISYSDFSQKMRLLTFLGEIAVKESEVYFKYGKKSRREN